MESRGWGGTGKAPNVKGSGFTQRDKAWLEVAILFWKKQEKKISENYSSFLVATK